ncbi:MAG: tRNA lysidine(34) synthetase TilS [Neomegalonema sp.]|nr:tRNA lysidine(34) synthetase TilS [Neomegalonema sp.]
MAPGGVAPPALALAVSGGGDSTALLLIAAEWAAQRAAAGEAVRLVALTVDHALRAGSRAEAERVAELCASLGVAHEILTWRHGAGAPVANVQAEARTARYALLAERRRALSIGPLLTAHTADDVAEGFLIRLGRGSGVDGLARMAARRVEDRTASPPLEIWRPFLEVSGEALRAACRARGVAWIEDPSNADPRYARVAARETLRALAPLGLTTARLARTAATMARAREALEFGADAHLQACASYEPAYGAVRIAVSAFADAPREIALRAFSQLLRRIGGGAVYPPRLDALEAAYDALFVPSAQMGRTARTLHGCVLAPGTAGELWLGREARAAQSRQVAGSFIWDGRFQLDASPEAAAEGYVVAPVGASAARPANVVSAPPTIRAGAPGIWRNQTLIGAPTLGNPVDGVTIRPIPALFG